jgi:hypothetical protein
VTAPEDELLIRVTESFRRYGLVEQVLRDAREPLPHPVGLSHGVSTKVNLLVFIHGRAVRHTFELDPHYF